MYRDGDSCRIVDFKTGRSGTMETYRFQMELYALACHKLFGVDKVTAQLLFLNQNRIDTIIFNTKELANCEQRVIGLAQAIGRREFEYKKSEKCRFCSYSQFCSECKVVSGYDITKGISSYYKHFYELINLEQSVSTSNVADPVSIKFKQHLHPFGPDTLEYVVEYVAPTYFLKLRKGDFVNLNGTDCEPVRAQIYEVGKKTISFIVTGLRDWSKFEHMAEWIDPLSYSRMKQNLFDFYATPVTLKGIILQEAYPNLRDDLLPNISSSQLDKYQCLAVAKAVETDSVLIVHGPPGTGKTLTISHMVKELVARGNRVLVSAYTNRAVDGIVAKIIELSDTTGFIDRSSIVRLGRTAVVSNDVRGVTIDESLSTDLIAARIRKIPVVAVTSAGIRPDLFYDQFDYAIIDEASQMPEPFALGVVNHTKKLIMVGDNNQLPPVISHPDAQKGGLGISLFERMKTFFEQTNPSAVVMLENQYRMNDILMRFPSGMFYANKLKAGTQTVADKRYKLSVSLSLSLPDWLCVVLNPLDPLVYVAVDKMYSGDIFPTTQCVCDVVLKGIGEYGIPFEDVGIISPYRREVNQLRRTLTIAGLEIDTIDRFQGSDKEIIILSCAMRPGILPPLLTDPRRFNVALTRAKSKLVVVGTPPDGLDKTSMFVQFYRYIEQYGKVVMY